MFKEDYHFDNDVYGARKLGAKVYQWWAKRGDIVLGKPFIDEVVKGYISLEGEKRGLVECSILELVS
jgi:hypothetical protein